MHKPDRLFERGAAGSQVLVAFCPSARRAPPTFYSALPVLRGSVRHRFEPPEGAL